MFYCERCRKKWKWPESMSRSLGKCEICEDRAACYDVPSSRLPDPTGIVFREGRPTDDA